MSMETFRVRFREARKGMNLTQQQLAEILHTNNSSICDWECGRSQPDLETLAMAACYFDVSVDYLLGLEDETGAKKKPYFTNLS